MVAFSTFLRLIFRPNLEMMQHDEFGF
jgi:hypothetical protein